MQLTVIILSSAKLKSSSPLGTISAPDIALDSSAVTYPPTLIVTTYGDHIVGDTFRLQTATDFGFTSIDVNLTYTLTGNTSTDSAGINSLLSTVESPDLSYIRARIERTNYIPTWSNILFHGNETVPSVTSNTSIQVTEGDQLSASITTDLPAYILLGGADQIHFEIVGDRPNTSYTLTGWDGKVFDYDTPDDFNSDHIYSLNFEVEGLNGATGTESGVTVTVLDLDETPDAFSFTDETGATISTEYTDSITVAGLGSGVAVPITVTGEFRIHDGTSWGSWLSDDSGIEVENGYQVDLRITSSSNYLTAVNNTLTIGGVSDTFTVTTMADPSSIGYSSAGLVVLSEGTNTHTYTGVAFEIGLGVIMTMRPEITSVTVDGNACTLVEVDHPSGNAPAVSMWKIDISTAGNYDIVITGPYQLGSVGMQAFTLTNTDGNVSDTAVRAFGFHVSPQTTSTSLTIPTGYLGLACIYAAGGGPLTWTTGTEIDSGSVGGDLFSVGFLTEDGTPTIDGGNYAGTCIVAAVFDKV